MVDIVFCWSVVFCILNFMGYVQTVTDLSARLLAFSGINIWRVFNDAISVSIKGRWSPDCNLHV